MSILELDKTIPVNPPTVNRKINPSDQSIGVSNIIKDFLTVVIQLKILIPVGIAIIIVAAVKFARVSISNPTVNMWWAHTINPKNPIDIIA
jgi:hypothetical protein